MPDDYEVNKPGSADIMNNMCINLLGGTEKYLGMTTKFRIQDRESSVAIVWENNISIDDLGAILKILVPGFVGVAKKFEDKGIIGGD